MGEPLENLLTMAERAYVRMQAAELITYCLEQEDLAPLQALVQQLVVAGEISLPVLREIADEIGCAQSALRREGLQAREDLKQALAGFGLHAPQLLPWELPDLLWSVRSRNLRGQIRASVRHLSPEDLQLVDQVCLEAGERVARIAARLSALGRLETVVRDWLDGLTYQAVRRGPDGPLRLEGHRWLH